MITKQEFCEHISFIQERQAAEIKIMQVLGEEFDDFFGFLYNKYEEQFVRLLNQALELSEDNDILSCWVYEWDFGRFHGEDAIIEADGTIVDVSTPEKFYDYIIKEYHETSNN